MNKNFTKADLKAGYILKLRNGRLEMVMVSGIEGNKHPRLVSIGSGGCWGDITNDVTDDLCSKNRDDRHLDIMEVYGYAKFASVARDVSTNNRDLLWKREEAQNADKSDN